MFFSFLTLRSQCTCMLDSTQQQLDLNGDSPGKTGEWMNTRLPSATDDMWPGQRIISFSVCRCGMSAESSRGESFLWWRGGGQRAKEWRSARDEHQQSAQLQKRVRFKSNSSCICFNHQAESLLLSLDVNTVWSTHTVSMTTGDAAGMDRRQSSQREAQSPRKERCQTVLNYFFFYCIIQNCIVAFCWKPLPVSH